jgi:4-amino-4-deoxy-L-arabinose transferase-like glycosyltransferase
VVLRRHWALLAVLAIGVVLRVVLLAAYTPANLSYPDTWGYAKAAAGPLFFPEWIRPAGYPALLAGLHAVWGSLSFVIVLQHLMGLATAVLAYATMLRAGAPRWVALVPAAVLALTLDAIYYEHSLLSETPFTLLVTGALYCGVRSLERSAGIGWALASGALLGLATTFRGVALFAIPVFVVVLALREGAWRRRLLGAGAVAASAAALLLGYAALQDSQNGHFGLTQGSGWSTYARSAPFADCRLFTPPAGTQGLCDARDARVRFGPDWYAWSPRSPAQRLFGGPPSHSAAVGAFGRAAIEAQPRAYVRAVAVDLWRYVDPDAGIDRNFNGDEPKRLDLDRPRRPKVEANNLTVVEPLYGHVDIRTKHGTVHALAGFQRVVRVHGLLVLACILLSLAAAVLARGRDRAVMLLLAGTALVPVILATATTVYNWRYIVPMLPALTAAGAFGGHIVGARLGGARRLRATAIVRAR